MKHIIFCILLGHPRCGMYYAGPGRSTWPHNRLWTADIKDAFGFRSPEDAEQERKAWTLDKIDAPSNYVHRDHCGVDSIDDAPVKRFAVKCATYGYIGIDGAFTHSEDPSDVKAYATEKEAAADCSADCCSVVPYPEPSESAPESTPEPAEDPESTPEPAEDPESTPEPAEDPEPDTAIPSEPAAASPFAMTMLQLQAAAYKSMVNAVLEQTAAPEEYTEKFFLRCLRLMSRAQGLAERQGQVALANDLDDACDDLEAEILEDWTAK